MNESDQATSVTASAVPSFVIRDAVTEVGLHGGVEDALLRTMASMSASAIVQKDGYNATKARPIVKTAILANIPNFRPRRSAMGAKIGLVAPSKARTVITADIVSRLTPNPRAKTDKNG